MNRLWRVVTLSAVLLGQAGGFSGALDEFFSDEKENSRVQKRSDAFESDAHKDAALYSTFALETLALSSAIALGAWSYYRRRQNRIYESYKPSN